MTHIRLILCLFIFLIPAFSSGLDKADDKLTGLRYQSEPNEESPLLLSTNEVNPQHSLDEIRNYTEQYIEKYINSNNCLDNNNNKYKFMLRSTALILGTISGLPYMQAAYDSVGIPAVGYLFAAATFISVGANTTFYYLHFIDQFLSNRTPEEEAVLPPQSKIPVMQHVTCNVLGVAASLHLISMGYFFNIEEVRLAAAIDAGLTGYAFATIGFYETFEYLQWFSNESNQNAEAEEVSLKSISIQDKLYNILLKNEPNTDNLVEFKSILSSIDTIDFDDTIQGDLKEKQYIKDAFVYSGTSVLISSVYVTFSMLAYELLGLMGIPPDACIALAIISTIPFSTLVTLASNDALGGVFNYFDNWINNIEVKTINSTIFPIANAVNPWGSLVLSALSAPGQYYIAYETCENYEWLKPVKHIIPPIYYVANTIFEGYTLTGVIDRALKTYASFYGTEEQRYKENAADKLAGLNMLLSIYHTKKKLLIKNNGA